MALGIGVAFQLVPHKRNSVSPTRLQEASGITNPTLLR